jgi:putative ABC transport system permease protein
MLKFHLIRRQIVASRHQAVLFVLCTALSLVTLVSLSGFSRSVHNSFLHDARTLHAADIIIHSHSPFSKPLLNELAFLEKNGVVKTARIHEFYSLVRPADREASLLVNVKTADPGYPFYGTVELASGRSFSRVLAPGRVVVEQALLDRLNLKIGGRLRVGSATFLIEDVVLLEPDRPVNFFSLGPRVFVSGADLASLHLVAKGSRVNYSILAKVKNERELNELAGRLKSRALGDRERVDTYRTARSGIKRFFDNFLFFLNLIAIFTLLLAGIGIQSSLFAFLKEQERTIAIMKALGAGSRFIIVNYLGVAFALGLAGTLIGLAASVLLERVLPGLFSGLLPSSVELSLSVPAIAEGLVLGVVVVVLFTLLPLARLKDVRPRAIFSKAELPGQGRFTRLFIALAAVFFCAMVLWRIEELKTGVYFVLGVGLLVLVSLLAALGVLRFLRKQRVKNLVLRQALKGLFRPQSASLPILVTLIAALALVFSITLVEKNLDASFVRSYPVDSPNVFFIDIQPSQKEAFTKDLGIETTYYPVVRGTVIAVNNERIDREQERAKRGDNLAREFNLTYRETLLPDERIVAGKRLFQEDWSGPQVSVLDTVLEMKPLKIGDTVTFRIQGVLVDARISSIRTRTRASLSPFFYFVFQDRVLADAPQALFTAVRIEKEGIAPLQNRIAARFPNVSVIDVSETVTVFARIMSRLSLIVNFFTLFSVAAGILIIISSVIATRHARIREAVFFTILGARGRFVLAVFGAESLILGFASGAIALALSQAASFFISRNALSVPYTPFAGMSLMMVLAATACVGAVGLIASIPILRNKPAAFLREQTDE